jgi:hypothetical protein
MSKKRKLDDDIEGEWTPETEKEERPPTKRAKLLEEKREKRANTKFIKAIRKAIHADPDGLRFRVTKRITKAEFKYLTRDIEVGEIFYEAGDPYSCASPTGVMATANPDISWGDKRYKAYELPHSHIDVDLSVPYDSDLWKLW